MEPKNLNRPTYFLLPCYLTFYVRSVSVLLVSFERRRDCPVDPEIIGKSLHVVLNGKDSKLHECA
ncbi:BgTH12-04785 [Blumeria graminis f. sp. triticale]|uniref:BgTH12-04785 n=1 Tax=Blumeria graminis f. sp. triticale TaxID=1689686 RepID=A0A9W4GCA3_BLUGR|nr:BgTH12-04785 [Blumeria graminis f. sp. triticale]